MSAKFPLGRRIFFSLKSMYLCESSWDHSISNKRKKMKNVILTTLFETPCRGLFTVDLVNTNRQQKCFCPPEVDWYHMILRSHGQ